MKIALICPSNMLYMPYVDNYIEILKENNIDYIIINWDRFGIEQKYKFTYKDNKEGHQRSFYDYQKYYRFIKDILNQVQFDKIIVFGLQLTFFLKSYLVKNFENKYIIDIRDYNKILRLFSPRKVIEKSSFTTISSPAYKEWLPKINKYIINHNTRINSIANLNEAKPFCTENIIISYIGSLANFEENKDLIDSLKNNERFTLIFYGSGTINNMIENYIRENQIRNVQLYGRYSRDEESQLYLQADLINMILYNKNINDKTCIANRVYNSALYGRPIIGYKGTFLAKIINKYKLGLVLDSFDNAEERILNYISSFNNKVYDKGRISFINDVIEENQIFVENLISFISR